MSQPAFPTTDQAIFDFVVRHLAQQGGPSRDDTSCLHHGPHGRSCPVGCLLTTEEAKLTDDEDVRWLYASGTLPLRLVSHIDLLEALQAAHDLAKFDGESQAATWRDPHGPGGIADRLLAAAIHLNLSPAVVTECFPEASS